MSTHSGFKKVQKIRYLVIFLCRINLTSKHVLAILTVEFVVTAVTLL